MHQRCTDIIKLNLYGMRSSLFALHLWIHNSGRNCAKLGLSLSKKSILFLRRKFRVFCTKNQLCFGVFEQENHFNWCWAPNGICFMNLSLSGWDFGSEALTRLLTCISVPDGALYSHPLSCHGGGSAHKGKFDVLKCTWLQVSKGWKSRGIAWVLKDLQWWDWRKNWHLLPSLTTASQIFSYPTCPMAIKFKGWNTLLKTCHLI